MNASYASFSRLETFSGVTSGIRATLPPCPHPWGLLKKGRRVSPARHKAQRLTPVRAGAAGCDGSMLACGFLHRVAHLTRSLLRHARASVRLGLLVGTGPHGAALCLALGGAAKAPAQKCRLHFPSAPSRCFFLATSTGRSE